MFSRLLAGPSRIIGFHEIRSIKRFWVVGNWYFYWAFSDKRILSTKWFAQTRSCKARCSLSSQSHSWARGFRMPVIHPEKICIYPICSSRSEVLSPALIFNMGVFPLKTAVISLEPVRFVSPCFAVFLTKLSINLYASSTARAWWPSRYSFSTVFRSALSVTSWSKASTGSCFSTSFRGSTPEEASMSSWSLFDFQKNSLVH